MSCEHGGQREEDEEDMTGWRVMKKMKDGKVCLLKDNVFNPYFACT